MGNNRITRSFIWSIKVIRLLRKEHCLRMDSTPEATDMFSASPSCFPTSLTLVFFCPRGVIIAGTMINQWQWRSTKHIFVWLTWDSFVALRWPFHWNTCPQWGQQLRGSKIRIFLITMSPLTSFYDLLNEVTLSHFWKLFSLSLISWSQIHVSWVLQIIELCPWRFASTPSSELGW